MNRPMVPTGTARAQFLGLAAAAAAEPDALFTPGLWERLHARDVAEDALLAAWEVTRWAAGASLDERRALGCLVLALLDAMDSGSSLLALASDPTDPTDPTDPSSPSSPSDANAAARGASGLSGSLLRLGVPEPERHATRELARRLLDGSAPPGVMALCGPPGTRRPFILAGGAMYAERLWAVEDRLVEALGARLSRGNAEPGPRANLALDVALGAAAAVPGSLKPEAEQTVAIRAALTEPLTIIAGGPGTGKTSIVVAMLRVLARVGVPMKDVALAAPTGRAAQRMSESVNAALSRLQSPPPPDVELAASFTGATTIHRLLGAPVARVNGLEADGPVHTAAWPLPHAVVVIDEASMIDLALMEQLVSALRPEARLVLLGDADQLPSVDVGTVFRELAGAAPAATHRLARSHRMSPADPAGAEILRVATSLNAGAPAGTGVPPRRHARELALSGFERLAAGGLAGLLDRWHDEVLGAEAHPAAVLDVRYAVDGHGRLLTTSAGGDPGAVARLLGVHAAAKILCITRTAGRTASARAINLALHERLLATTLARGASDWLAAAPFLPGEPVLILRNDALRGLTNGDVGVVLRIGGPRGEALGVALERADGIVVHGLEELGDDVGPAFALTVHKAQGSEYDRVAVVLPDTDVAPLTRETLYTAITRARRAVVVVGSPELFALGAARTHGRASGIGRRLASGMRSARRDAAGA